MVSGFGIAPVFHTAYSMTFIGLAWVVSYMGSFYAPQAFLNSIPHLFANSNSALPTQPSAGSTAAIAPSSNTAAFGYSPGSLLRWLPRPDQTRVFRIAANSLTINVVQTSQPSVKPVEPRVGADQSLPLGISKHCTASGQARTLKPSLRPIGFQIRIKGQAVAELPTRSSAEKLAHRLREVLNAPGFDPLTLQLTRIDGRPAGKAGERSLLFTIDPTLENSLRRSGDLVAIDWVNNLRVILGVAPLPLVQAQTQLYALSATGRTLQGTASWYGPYFHNRLTAAGERFDQDDLTAAHPSLPFDTYLKVTNQKNQESVIVRINDRGPYVGKRSLDLSRQAARCIDSETAGVVPYSAVIMQPGEVKALTKQPSARVPSPVPSVQKLARVDPR